MTKLFDQKGSAILRLFVMLTIIGLFAVVVIMAGFHRDHQLFTKKYFGITVEWSIPEEEILLLRPMVERRMENMTANYADAAAAEARFFDDTNGTMPATADETLARFREAKALKEAWGTDLYRACAAARYFRLLEDDNRWCQ